MDNQLRQPGGFTLIELLVSMTVLTILGILAFSVLSQMQQAHQIGRNSVDRFGELQFALQLISRDVQQLSPRPIRIGFGQPPLPAALADGRNAYSLEVSRGGWRNPVGRPRGTLQRVAYRVDEEGILLRAYWQSLDYGTNEPLESELLDGVELIEVRFLDSTRQWHTQWPPLTNATPGIPTPLPIAVEVNLELEDFGRITRLFEIAS